MTSATACDMPADVPASVLTNVLANALDDTLPQTQCTRCGYADCRAYADAIAVGETEINQCPPGGREGIERLAALTGHPMSTLNPANGEEVPRRLAVVDEIWCIGCTLCLKACPVDCIVGGPKVMHTVIDELCTGCELCIPACPVDCISLRPVTGERTGWQAWSPAQAQRSRERHRWHRSRSMRDALERVQRLASPLSPTGGAAQAPAIPKSDAPPSRDKRTVIEAALARARAARSA